MRGGHDFPYRPTNRAFMTGTSSFEISVIEIVEKVLDYGIKTNSKLNSKHQTEKKQHTRIGIQEGSQGVQDTLIYYHTLTLLHTQTHTR